MQSYRKDLASHLAMVIVWPAGKPEPAWTPAPATDEMAIRSPVDDVDEIRAETETLAPRHGESLGCDCEIGILVKWRGHHPVGPFRTVDRQLGCHFGCQTPQRPSPPDGSEGRLRP